jgi:pimeloyl-ACP methyl ester carboxylesterase
MSTMKRVMTWSLAILLCVAAALVLFRRYEQRRVANRIAIKSLKGIASLEKIRLGGVDQWIQIRGQDRAKPILLFLHSGPGFPQMPFSHVNAALEREFVVVHWDQRGAGKSYSSDIAKTSMNIEQFVSDAHDVVQLLIERFGGPKIFLVAHSWGTAVGALTVSRYPNMFYAYVGISQVADVPASENCAYRFALDKAKGSGSKTAVSELATIGPPPYKRFADYHKMKKWVAKFSRRGKYEISVSRFVWLAFVSPVYSWHDLLRIPLGMRFSFSNLWRQAFYNLNLFQQARRIEVPVYFFEGRHDYTVTVTAETAGRYFQALDAPRGKKLIWFEDSAHWPHVREPDKYRDILVNIVLDENGPPGTRERR